MAIRYRQELLNLAGVYFKIEILDNDYIGSVLDFYLKDFEIDWKGQQAERNNFILGSECVVMAQSTDNYDLTSLMDDLRGSEEGRFQIAVYKKENLGDSYFLYWLGLVLNDLSGGEDSAPVQTFDIVATDGLGILKGIDYKVNDTTPYGDLSVLEHLMNCLKTIPYNSFFGSNDLFLYSIVHLYESAMANSTDAVLNRIQVPGATFYDLDKNGNYEYKTCYEVLELLTVLFKSRLFLENGVWRFYELYSLENTTDGIYKAFQYDGTEKTEGLTNWTALNNTEVSEDGLTITKINVAGWNGSARSTVFLESGVDGWASTEISANNNDNRFFGLATYNTSTSYTDIEYSFFIRSDGKVRVYESNANRGQVTTCTTGDILSIERIGTTVYYKKNGTTVYTSSIASSDNLYVDICLKEVGAELYNTKASFCNQLELQQTLTGGFSGGNRLTGQRFEWLPALKEVKQTYIHDSSDNLLDVVVNSANGQQQVLSSLPSNGDETLMLSGVLTVNLVKTASPYTTNQIYIKVRMTIKHGPYYYVRTVTNSIQNNDYSTANWSLTAGYLEYILVQNVNQYGGQSVGYGFETLELLSSGALEMNLEIVYVQDLQQNDKSSDYTATATIIGSYLEYIDGDAENKRIYRSYNNTTSFYSSVLEFPEALCGDRITPMTPNNLKVWDGSTWIESTGTWKRNALNGTSTLLQLTLNEFLAGQRKFIKKRQGMFVGKFNPLLAIGVSSESYLPLGVRFSANDATFEGEWYKIGEFNNSGIVETASAVGISSVIPPSVQSNAPKNQTGATGVQLNNGSVSIDNLTNRTIAISLNGESHSYITDSFGVGGSNKVESAVFSIESTTKGFLLPRMTATQKNAISSPAEGLMIFQTDGVTGFYGYVDSGWAKL